LYLIVATHCYSIDCSNIISSGLIERSANKECQQGSATSTINNQNNRQSPPSTINNHVIIIRQSNTSKIVNRAIVIRQSKPNVDIFQISQANRPLQTRDIGRKPP
jgi:hypothetical protein